MIAFLDTPAGISGDMFLGCLVDAGWTIDQLRATLAKLPHHSKSSGKLWMRMASR